MEEKNYQEILNKYELFDYDSIQFYININTNKSDKFDEKCAICLETNINLKIKCCEGYFHNSCLYDTFKFNNKTLNLEYKKIIIHKTNYELLTNNINEKCPICRRELNKCDIISNVIEEELNENEIEANRLNEELNTDINIENNPLTDLINQSINNILNLSMNTPSNISAINLINETINISLNETQSNLINNNILDLLHEINNQFYND